MSAPAATYSRIECCIEATTTTWNRIRVMSVREREVVVCTIRAILTSDVGTSCYRAEEGEENS